MKKRVITYSLIFLLLYLFNAVFVPFTLFGAGAEYILVGTVCLAMVEKERFGALYGLIFGVLLDFTSSAVFGSNAFLFMAAGYLVGALARQKISVSLLGALAMTGASLVVIEGVSALLYSFLISEAFVDVFIYTVLPKIALSLPLAALLYPVFALLRKAFTSSEERAGTW